MQFSQLNNDVILEIFLQFMAIDWDGPFTLMLVCTKWSTLVLSQPRVWTWIMVDETQAEWRERMEVAAHLSKNLPLQIVLRVPFVSQVSLSHITRRCSSLFLGPHRPVNLYSVQVSRAWTKTMVSYEEFTEYSAEFKQSNDSISNFLGSAPIHAIKIRTEDKEHASFAYSAWHVYERLNQRASIQEVIKSGETFIITSLVFKHSESASFTRIKVLITDLWEILPLLSNLSYLELADNYIKLPEDTALSHIQLRSLLTLKIESPMLGSFFSSLEDEVSLGLLSLLDVLTAPNLEDLSLLGPLHRIIAAMVKSYGRFHPLLLNISISMFEKTVDQERLDIKSIWHGIRRCAVAIPEQNKSGGHTASEAVEALRLLFKLIPRRCSIQLYGDAILDLVMQSDLLRDVDLHTITQLGYSRDAHEPLNSPPEIRSLSLIGQSSTEPERVPWISSVEELWTEAGLTLIYPYGPELPMRVLDCGASTVFHPEIVPIGDVTRSDSFSNLIDIRCGHRLAVWMIINCETRQLRSLTLLADTSSLSEVLDVVEKASSRLPSLDTLGISGIPEWEYLFHFVARFNRPLGRGISIVKLRDVPHPAILHYLGRAFRGEADEPKTLAKLFQYQRYRLKKHYPHGCFECTYSGWSCHEYLHCSRWRRDHMVSITADMPLTKYEGDWGPDGQGWEDDPDSSDGSEMDTEYENAGDTSDNLGE